MQSIDMGLTDQFIAFAEQLFTLIGALPSPVLNLSHGMSIAFAVLCLQVFLP